MQTNGNVHIVRTTVRKLQCEHYSPVKTRVQNYATSFVAVSVTNQYEVGRYGARLDLDQSFRYTACMRR